MKNWYILLKDFNGHKTGEKLEMESEDGEVLVTAKVAEACEAPIVDADQDLASATTKLQKTITETVTKAFADASTTLSSDVTKSLNIHVGKENLEDDPTLGFKSVGDFAMVVKDFSINSHSDDERLKVWMSKAPTGMGEITSDDGGVLVPTVFSDTIWSRAFARNPLLEMVSTIPLDKGNTYSMPQLAETERTNGFRHGGVRGYWVEEAADITASSPKFTKIHMRVKKVAALVYVTSEQLEDTPTSLGAFIDNLAGSELAFQIGDAIINGNGAGQPQGILTANATVSVAKESSQTATTIVTANIDKMYSRLWAPSIPNAVWLINQDVQPQLDNLHAGFTITTEGGTPHIPLYRPPGGLADTPFGSLKGRPVLPVEFMATLGSVGDIMLVDLKEYLMITRGGINKESSIHLRFIQDEMAFRFTARIDGQSMWPTALTPFKGTNTLSPFVSLAVRS